MIGLGWRATRHGWLGFEGLGRPWEAWSFVPLQGVGYVSEHAEMPTGWRSHGRCFTRRGAIKRAKLRLAERIGAERT